MKILRALSVVLLFFAIPLFATPLDDVKTKAGDISEKLAGKISDAMAPNFGFYSGSGNITPVNTSTFLGLKLGLGLGLNFNLNNPTSTISSSSSDKMADALNAAATSIAVIPFPYDYFYVKIGIPTLPMDAGIRFGMIPAYSVTTSDGSVGISEFHFGAEARYVLWEAAGGILKVDGRGSIDYDGGAVNLSAKTSQDVFDNNGNNVGKSDLKMGWNMTWGGVSFGVKLMGGLNIPIIGSIYGGLGANMNFGSFKTTVKTEYDVTGLAAGTFSVEKAAEKGYNLIDLRAIAGAQILFINTAIEYGILNQNLAVNFTLLSLAF